MGKEEFLQLLRDKLAEELDDYQVQTHIQYYEHYISDEVNRGRTVEEVIEELGDPRLIARTLMDTGETFGARYNEKENGEIERQQSDSRKKGKWLDLSTWYGKVLLILIAAGILALLVTILSALLPFLIILFLISVVLRYFRKR